MSSCSDPPPRGSRRSPTPGCSAPPRPGCPGRCRSGTATPWAGRWSWAGPWAPSSARSAPRRRRPAPPGPAPPGSTSGARPTCSPTSPSRSRPPATCPTTARCSSSGSATSWATGGWSCTPPSARRSTRPGRWCSRPGCASGTASTSPPCTPMTASCCGCPTPPASRRRATSPCWSPTTSGGGGPPGWVARRGSPGGSARGHLPALPPTRFRECAARALLLPRRDPRRRTPLWQQRQRAAQLLAVASEFASFPITLEAAREVLQDVYDVPGLVELMRDVRARRVRVVDVQTQTASPFAQSLLFGYVGQFLYEGDAPLAERRAQALALDTGLLAELLGRSELRELLDADAMAEVEAELQRLPEQRHPRDMDGASDLLRGIGDLTPAEAVARGVPQAWLDELVAARRALSVRIAGQERYVAIEDAGRLRDALGTALPVGVPEIFTEPVADPLGDLIGRYARTHGPFAPPEVAARLGLGVAVVTATVQRLVGTGRLVTGEFRPGGIGQEWCDAEVLRSIRRRSLAKLRQEVEPVPIDTLARFTPSWQSVGGRMRGVDGVLAVVEQLAGALVPASALESLVLPGRVQNYSPAMLDELTSAGEVLWAGAGGLPGGDGWFSLVPADLAPLLLPEPLEPGRVGDGSEGSVGAAVLERLAGGQALFFRGLSDLVCSTDDAALADIV